MAFTASDGSTGPSSTSLNFASQVLKMASISLLDMELLKWGVNPWDHMEASTTDTTHAKCWTLSRDGAVDETLGPQDFSEKLRDITTTLKQSADSPTFTLITAIGDPNKEFAKRRNCPLQITNDGQPTGDFDLLNSLLGMNAVTYGVYTTARQNCSYVLEYDDALQNLQAIIFLVRCPILSRSIVCVMRVQIPTLSSVAFVCCPHSPDLDRLRDSCKSSHTLLRASPVGLLALIYEQRGQDYEGWVTRVALESHEIEVFMRMSPPGWTYHRLSPSRYKELSDTDRLLSHLQSTDIEICHGHSIMSFAVRFGDFCRQALDVIEGKLGVPKLAPGARAMVQDRIRFSMSRCLSVRERFEELTHRHRGQINASFSLIAQKDSKVNQAMAGISVDVARVTALDSRTMKTIAVLTLVFLPSSLVTSLWQANIFHLSEDTNGKVYAGTTVAVTAAVFFCWWLFMRLSQKPLEKYSYPLPQTPGPDPAASSALFTHVRFGEA